MTPHCTWEVECMYMLMSIMPEFEYMYMFTSIMPEPEYMYMLMSIMPELEYMGMFMSILLEFPDTYRQWAKDRNTWRNQKTMQRHPQGKGIHVTSKKQLQKWMRKGHPVQILQHWSGNPRTHPPKCPEKERKMRHITYNRIFQEAVDELEKQLTS